MIIRGRMLKSKYPPKCINVHKIKEIFSVGNTAVKEGALLLDVEKRPVRHMLAIE